jgi:predicted nuclease of restriction endonuclease-like (RecB) superfamily
MVQFAEVFPEEQIVVLLIRHLSWTHFIALLPLKEPLQREFYAEMCRVERWSVRTLRQKIDSMLYERTAISRKPEALIRHELASLRNKDQLSPDLVFKDPYFLNFLGLRDHYLEKDLEDAILRELEQFLLELGAGFTFIARQKRIQVDNDDYYIDRLFFNRKLRRLIAIELKLGDFKPADNVGQMELYLRWLDKYERQDDENPPIGLVLCAGKKRETVELLEIENSGIRIAEYLTELPPRQILTQKLHKALEQAKRQFQNRIES